MDLLQNPFHILTASSRDNRQRIIELADERSLLLDSSECEEARSDLINPRKRLKAEVAWLPGIGPKRVGEILSLLKSSPSKLIVIDKLPPITRANLVTAGLARLPDYTPDDVVEWIIEIAREFEDIDPKELCVIINEERIVSGFPEVTDLSAVEEEIQERRRHYVQVIKCALDNLSPIELVQAATASVELATNDGEEHGPVLIVDLVDKIYEVGAQGFLTKEEGNIKTLVENLRTAVSENRPDSVLTSMVNQFIKVVRNWHMVAQPIQISAKSRGLDHDASHRVAMLIRGLAVDIYNEHDKLFFSQQLTNMLQEVFNEVGEVAERVAEDADTLKDITEQRTVYAEVTKIKELVEHIKDDVDKGRPDSYLSQNVRKLCQFVNGWDIDPEHDASKNAAWLVRDLAIHMFNKHDKLDFSQQLTKSLLDVFAGVDEISKHIMDDKKALSEISENRKKLITQFKEFNLNGNSFSYKNKTYNTNDIRHIGFYRAITTHRTNFVKTGETEQVRISLIMSDSQEVHISVDEQGFFFNTNKSAQVQTVVEFYSYLSDITFDRRVEFYVSQIKDNGYFVYDKCYFYPKDKIVFKDKEFNLRSTSFLRGYGYIEMRKKDFGLLDKIKREVPLTRIPQFSTLVDTDVIFHLLYKYFSLKWKS